MYSVVLLMALSGGAETPAAHGCNGCSGGHGCHGGLFSRSSHGCNGCNGCSGGHKLFSHKGHGCSGCTGCSAPAPACSGSCSGCHGGHKLFHRHKSCNGCSCACHGAPVACAGAGCAGCAGAPAPAPKPVEKPKEMPAPKKTEEANISAPATVIVSLPAEATLKVDDHLTTSTSATRVFVSPSLNVGHEFSYTLTGEIVRDGKPVVVAKRITVRAGEETRVSFEFPVASVASK